MWKMKQKLDYFLQQSTKNKIGPTHLGIEGEEIEQRSAALLSRPKIMQQSTKIKMGPTNVIYSPPPKKKQPQYHNQPLWKQKVSIEGEEEEIEQWSAASLLQP